MGGGRVAPGDPDLPPEPPNQPERPASRPGRGNRVAPAPDDFGVPNPSNSGAGAGLSAGAGPNGAPASQPPATRPVQAAWEPSPAEKRLEAHGEVYIPFRVAKAKVAEVQADMGAMKQQHLQIVNELESHYKEIEQDLQEYFLNYIKKLNASGSEKEKREKGILARVNAEATQYREMAEQALLEATTSNQELTERIQALEDELENQGRGVNVLNEQHDAQLAELNEAHGRELAAAEERRAGEVAELEAQQAAEKARAEEAHGAEVEELKQRLAATSGELGERVEALEEENVALRASLGREREQNARSEAAGREHAAVVAEVVGEQREEAAAMEAEVGAWIEETEALKAAKAALEAEVERLTAEKETAVREREDMRVSMEDGGRQMQADIEQLRADLAEAEERGRELEAQVAGLEQEVAVLTEEKETAEGVGQRMAVEMHRMEEAAAKEEERTLAALLRAMAPLEAYAQALAEMLAAVGAPVELPEEPPAEDAVTAIAEDATAEGEKAAGDGAEGVADGGKSSGGEARQVRAVGGKARREGAWAEERLRRIAAARAAVEGAGAQLSWPESERTVLAGPPATIAVQPVIMAGQQATMAEPQAPAEEAVEGAPATIAVEAVEGVEEAAAATIAVEPVAMEEAETEGGGAEEKRKDGEEDGEAGAGAEGEGGEGGGEKKETEEEGETAVEVVQGEGEGVEDGNRQGEGESEARAGEERAFGGGGLMMGEEEEAAVVPRERGDMVGDAAVKAAGERIAGEQRRLCAMLLAEAEALAARARAGAVERVEAAEVVETLRREVKESLGEVQGVAESLQEMEKGGAFATAAVLQQQAANKVLAMAKGEGEEAVAAQAKAAAERLTKNREKILEKKKQVQMAAQKLREEFEAIDESQESLEEMDEEERTEFVKIRKREFELMERRLKEKDAELSQHMEANKKMELVLAASADGQGLSAEEAQELVERHATELDDLREESGHRISKLQAEVSQLRETLDTDQEALQDNIDELREQVDDNENKLIAAYDQIQSLSDQLKAVEEASGQTEAELRQELFLANEKFVKIDLEYKQAQAKKAEEQGESAEKEMEFMKEQVRMAKAALKEVETRDKEDSAQKGEAKMKRSATAKNAFWELQKVEQDLDKRKEEVEAAKAELEKLREEEEVLAKEFEEKQLKAKEEAEAAQQERMAKLEAQFEARREQLRAQEEERVALAEKKAEEAAALAAIQAQAQAQGGDHLLDQLKDEVRGAAGGKASGPQAANRARAKAQAQRLQKEKQLAAAQATGDAKKLKEAEKRMRQMEANEKKLEAKIHKLEEDVAKGGGGGGGGGGKGGPAAGKKEPAGKGGKGDSKGGGDDKDLKKLTKDNEKLEKELAKAKEAAEQGAAWKKELDGMKAEVKRMTTQVAELEVLYKKEMGLRKKYYNQIEDMKGKIRVYARCRPFAKYEKEKQCKQCVNFLDDQNCKVDCGKKGMKDYTFDEVYRMDSKQEEIFEGVSYLVQSAVDGFNVCIFAYGQTGSGKTFTMYGKRDDESLWGIAPRCMKELYEIIEREQETYEIKVTCYMLELYNDQLVDLLPDRDKKGNLVGPPSKLDIKLDARGIVQVQGAVVRGPCNSFEELYKWNEYGNDQRHVASTAMNAESSRSHLVFSVIVESKNRQTGAATLGKLTLVDLAGSERQSKTNATGERLKEAKSINISLSALGNVISALSTGEKFVPYRDNLLTRLLQDGLGGNAKTLMFVNISPADYNADETASSLTYAARVKLITNDASKAQESAEVQRLKKVIKLLKSGVDPDKVEEMAAKEDGSASQVQEMVEEAPDDSKSKDDDVDDSRWMEGPDFEREEIANAEREAAAQPSGEGGEMVEASADD